MKLLAIDPGSTMSGIALIDTGDCCPLRAEKIDNHSLLYSIQSVASDLRADHVAIEMVASYGMAVGAEVFDTCVWIGRFTEAIRRDWAPWTTPRHVFRRDVKLHLCGQTRAKDSNIVQALVDRFTPGAPHHGKGTKARPGWFYGFKADVWQAYALAVTIADRIEGRQP